MKKFKSWLAVLGLPATLLFIAPAQAQPLLRHRLELTGQVGRNRLQRRPERCPGRVARQL